MKLYSIACVPVRSRASSLPNMLNKVLSSSLLSRKMWFALNIELCGCRKDHWKTIGTFSGRSSFGACSGVYCLRNKNGGLVPAKWFNGGNRTQKDVFVGIKLATLVANLRRKDPEKFGYFTSKNYCEKPEY